MAHGVSKTKHILTRVSLFKDWYKLIFPFNRLISKSQTLHLRNGAVAEVGNIFSSDVSVLMEVFAENTYQLEKFNMPSRPVVFDVGANIGAFSLAVHLRWPQALITAFEPSPRNFALLQKNAPFAQCEQKAVAGTNGVVHIQSAGTHTALKLVESGGIEVEAVSLQEALRDVPVVDLLKVDIEGAEYEVFAHVTPETLAKVKNILMEVHDPSKINWFETLLKQNGFAVEWLNPQLVRARKL